MPAGDYRLAKPPVLDTDIATNEQFYTHAISGRPAYTSYVYTTFAGDTGSTVTWAAIATRLGTTVTLLRSLNPGISTNNPGSDITVGVFAGSGAILFPNPGIKYPTTVPAIPPPAVSYRHRYAPDAVGITGIALTPAGHGRGIDAGIWAVFSTMDASYGGSAQIRLAFRTQPRSVKEYATGWQVQPTPIAANAADPNAFNVYVQADIASQRLGDFVYVFGASSHTTVTSYQFDAFGNQTPDRNDTDSKLLIQRIGADRAITTRYNIDASTVGETTLLSRNPIPAFADNNAHQFFVSDDATPFIWGASSSIAGLWGTGSGGSNQYTPAVLAALTANPNPWNGVGVIGFADDGSGNFGTWKRTPDGTSHVTGQLGAYLQASQLPNKVYGFGPVLVHPWSAGHYGAPELWYFVARGANTAVVFDVYRAKWARNQYRRMINVSVDDDPSFQNGNRKFPALNPDGYAFDPDWYRPANKVTSIGPLPGAKIWNRSAGPSADSGTIVTPGFRVMRDANRVGMLHLLISNSAALIDDGGSYTPDNSLRNVWVAVSGDDGKTWQQPRSVANLPDDTEPNGTGKFVTHGYYAVPAQQGMPALRTPDQLTILGFEHINMVTASGTAPTTAAEFWSGPADSGAYASLVIMNYNALGAATAEENSVVFKRPPVRMI